MQVFGLFKVAFGMLALAAGIPAQEHGHGACCDQCGIGGPVGNCDKNSNCDSDRGCRGPDLRRGSAAIPSRAQVMRSSDQNGQALSLPRICMI
ncbi:hypothetical protein PWT90_03949 [Aphanocladium album]|nr:hypothetical protein PWT90_03949 [Aphanocladium album]